MMSLDRWADSGAGGRFGGGVAAAFFLLPAVSALLLLFVSFAPSVNNCSSLSTAASMEVQVVGNGWDEDGGRWLWKPGTTAVFSSPLQRCCFSSWFPLFSLSTLFFPLYSSFMEVQVLPFLPMVQRWVG
jgi:hypothetical protein